jgi:hypothetical protein
MDKDQLWTKAYNLHYKGSGNHLAEAKQLYEYLVSRFPDTDEAGYAQSQSKLIDQKYESSQDSSNNILKDRIEPEKLELSQHGNYRVYQNHLGDIQTVKVGWSWPAFLFGGIWALFKGLIPQLLISALLSIVLYFLSNIIATGSFVALTRNVSINDGTELGPYIAASYAIVYLIYSPLFLSFGLFGNSWLASKLENTGFKHIGNVEASDSDAALRKVRSAL